MTLTAPLPETDTHADEAAAILATNRRRRKIRKWIAIGSIPLVLAGVAVSGKILSMYAFAHQSISSHVMGDHAGSLTAARGLEFANVFEEFRAPYNVGTALAMTNDLDGAKVTLEEAIALASGLDVCAPMINLALVLERQGDAAIQSPAPDAAYPLYEEALNVRADTPAECETEEAQQQSPDPNRDMAGTLNDLEERLREKLQPPPSGGGGGDDDEQDPNQNPEEQEDNGPSQEQLDELQDQLDQGAAERQERDQGDESGGGGADKPW